MSKPIPARYKLAVGLLVCGLTVGLVYVLMTSRSSYQRHILISEYSACLDGTPPSYYISYSNSADATKWMINFQGGGWCYDELSCLYRTQGQMGSSIDDNGFESNGGLTSTNCNTNPQFCNYNQVYVRYCDGTGFSGMREDPVIVSDVPLYFRGHYNLVDMISALMIHHGMDIATDVILTGASAGGSSVIVHGDTVRELLSVNTSLSIIPISGVFPDMPNINGDRVFGELIKSMYTISNAQANSECITAESAKTGGHTNYKCLMAEHALMYLQTPVFPVNSIHDYWNIVNILQIYNVSIIDTSVDTNVCTIASDGPMNDCSYVQHNAYIDWGAAVTSLIKNVTANSFLYDEYSHWSASDLVYTLPIGNTSIRTEVELFMLYQ